MLEDMTSCMTFISLAPLFFFPSGLLTLHYSLHLCVWCCGICTQSEKNSDGKRPSEIQPPTNRPVLRAWPTRSASSGPCSAQLLISARKDTVFYRKAMTEPSSGSLLIRDKQTDKQSPFQATKLFYCISQKLFQFLSMALTPSPVC